jgi:hypothetical protein
MYDSENEEELNQVRDQEMRDQGLVPTPPKPVVMFESKSVEYLKKGESHKLFIAKEQPTKPPTDYRPDFVMWELDFTRCVQHLYGEIPSRLECTAHLYKLESQMIKDYSQHNNEYYSYSVGDMLFMLYCYMICCDRIEARVQYPLTHLKTLFNKLVILGCQHTPERLNSYPSVEEIEELKTEVCAFIVQHYHSIEDTMLPLVEEWNKTENEENTELQKITKQLEEEEEKLKQKKIKDLEDDDLEGQYLFMSEEKKQEKERERNIRKIKDKITSSKYKVKSYQDMPENVRKEVEKLLYRDVEVLTKSSDEDVRKAAGGISDSNLGFLFTQTANDLVLKLIPLANRIFFQILLERRLSVRYSYVPAEELGGIPPTAFENFRKWLIDRCKKDFSDEFPVKYREIGFELRIPMGSRIALYRKAQTRSDAMPALSIIENELGYDQAEYQGELATMNLLEVASNTSHTQYEVLCLAMFNYMLKHELRIDFLADYYIRPTMFYMYFNAFDEKKVNNRPRRPLITFLQHRWCIHHNDRWIKCDNVIELLIRWIFLIQKDFKGETHDGKNIMSGWTLGKRLEAQYKIFYPETEASNNNNNDDMKVDEEKKYDSEEDWVMI